MVRYSMALAFTGAVATIAAIGPAAARPFAQRVVTCAGPFAKDSSHRRLVQVFGAKNVRYQKVHGAEGEMLDASVLYPGEPKARLEFIWNDKKARHHPWIRIEGPSTWKTANGIGVGTRIAAVEKLNGKPFKISGFCWDYGGQVTSLEKGALARALRGGCHVAVDFYPAKNAPQKAMDRISGQESFASNDPDVRLTRPTAGVVHLSYPVK